MDAAATEYRGEGVDVVADPAVHFLPDVVVPELGQTPAETLWKAETTCVPDVQSLRPVSDASRSQFFRCNFGPQRFVSVLLLLALQTVQKQNQRER